MPLGTGQCRQEIYERQGMSAAKTRLPGSLSKRKRVARSDKSPNTFAVEVARALMRCQHGGRSCLYREVQSPTAHRPRSFRRLDVTLGGSV